jgi:hypothetical protein
MPVSRSLKRSLVLAAATLAIAGATGGVAHAATLPSVMTLRDFATGRMLDSNSSGAVYTLPANGGDYQKWIPIRTSYGTYNLLDYATFRCLDSNTSGSVYTLPCNGGSFQKWIEIDSAYGSIVFEDLATGFVLDSNTSGSVYTLPWNGGFFQKWFFANPYA